MSDDDRLVQLRQRLDQLDDEPLASHPEVLEQTHRLLVDELDQLEHLGSDAAAHAEADQPSARADGADAAAGSGQPPAGATD